MDLKNIDLGLLIKKRVDEKNVKMAQICNFLDSTEDEVLQMYQATSLDTRILLRWSKLLEYDFFRIYSQHMVLYAPVASMDYNQMQENKKQSALPQFRKNLYTKEIIEFILEKINKEEMTKSQVINNYKIPKTTLYKWLNKYKK